MQDVIRDISPAVEIIRPFPWLWVSVIASALMILLIGLWLFSRRKKKVPPPPLVIPIPPGKEALKSLESLGFTDLKQYYIDLSLIVRRFIERRFELNAPEQTTDEFLVVASRSKSLDDSYRSMLEGFLREADMIKFAKFQVSPSHADESAQGLTLFVKESQNDRDFVEQFKQRMTADV